MVGNALLGKDAAQSAFILDSLSLVLFLITKLIPNSSAFMKVVLVTELIFLIRGSHKDYFKPST